jgi:hypothetical protein
LAQFLRENIPLSLLKGTVSRDFLPSIVSSKHPSWAPD